MKACFPVDILGSPLSPVDSVRNLSVWFDSDFSLSKHVKKNVCKSSFVKLRDFRHVSSRLDYRNSLFRSLSKFSLCKLQCIQNSAARIVFNTSQYTSVTPVLTNCIGFLWSSRWCLRQPHLFTSFFTQVYLDIFCSISFFLQQYFIHQARPKWWQFPCHSKVLPCCSNICQAVW